MSSPLWIGLYGDHTCEPLNLTKADVDIVEISRTLANICRFGGRSRPFLSVAQHSRDVAIAVEAVAPRYALAALLHDSAEAYPPGDLVTPIKKRMTIDGMPVARFEEKVLRSIFKHLDVEWPDDRGWTTIWEADHQRFLMECNGYLGRPFWTAVPEWDGRVPAPCILPDQAHREFMEHYERLRR